MGQFRSALRSSGVVWGDASLFLFFGLILLRRIVAWVQPSAGSAFGSLGEGV